jgi:hypothetical protein
MGLFYTNVILHKVQQRPLADFLGKQGRIAYVSPTQNNFTVIYDKETEDQDAKVLKSLAELLARKFRCVALASLVHDSDVYMYWLYKSGTFLDIYNSFPGYFDSQAGGEVPEGGDAKKLCTAFEKAGAISEVQRVFELVKQSNLNEDPDEYLQGEDIHNALVQALGMPSFGAFTGYYSIENVDVLNGLNRADLVQTQN